MSELQSLPESMVGLKMDPSLSPREAFDLFGKAPRIGVARKEALVMDRAELIHFTQGGDRIQGYRWGEAPYVLALHGWGARAATMTAFVDPILATEHGVLAFDHPGHGESEGEFCHALRVGECIRNLTEAFVAPCAAISHSFGSLGLTFSLLGGVPIRRVAMVSPTCLIPLRFRQWAVACGLSPNGVEEMMEISEEYFGRGLLGSHSIHQVAGRLAADALVIHDEGDQEVSISEAELIVEAWPGARLIRTTGLGHFRVLRDKGVIRDAVDFVTLRI
ncbi:MAG: lysophospholipase [Fimbriimonadaceae bacterium]|nr:lysophospholipase [Fimbriimonadaceae bacterium]